MSRRSTLRQRRARNAAILHAVEVTATWTAWVIGTLAGLGVVTAVTLSMMSL